jgi:hypothetical protein
LKHREEWRPILDAEVKRWSSMPLDQAVNELHEAQTYAVSVGSKSYQVEVDLLENTDTYVHLIVSVDDGTLPWSMFPMSEGILRHKTPTP